MTQWHLEWCPSNKYHKPDVAEPESRKKGSLPNKGSRILQSWGCERPGSSSESVLVAPRGRACILIAVLSKGRLSFLTPKSGPHVTAHSL